MKKLGVAALGLIGGLLVGFLLTEIISRIALGESGVLADSLPLALLLGFLTPGLAVTGIVVALAVDGRRQMRQHGASRHSRQKSASGEQL